MRSSGFLIGVIIFAVIGYAGYYFYNQTYEQTMTEIRQSSVAIPTAPATSGTASASAALSSVLPVPSGWQTYRSEKYDYTIHYPQNVEHQSTEEGDHFLYLGPTQGQGTELYDGISLIVRSVQHDGRSLKQLVERQHEIKTKEITTEKITEVTPVVYGTHQGFQFRVSALGEADYIYLPQSETSYLEIINSTVEPQSSKAVYQNTAVHIISTLQL